VVGKIERHLGESVNFVAMGCCWLLGGWLVACCCFALGYFVQQLPGAMAQARVCDKHFLYFSKLGREDERVNRFTLNQKTDA